MPAQRFLHRYNLYKQFYVYAPDNRRTISGQIQQIVNLLNHSTSLNFFGANYKKIHDFLDGIIAKITEHKNDLTQFQDQLKKSKLLARIEVELRGWHRLKTFLEGLKKEQLSNPTMWGTSTQKKEARFQIIRQQLTTALEERAQKAQEQFINEDIILQDLGLISKTETTEQ